VKFIQRRLTTSLPPAIFVVLLLLAATPLSAQEDTASDAQQTAPEVAEPLPDAVAVEDIADDSKIARRLQGIYDSSGWFKEVKIEAKNGFVKIEGIADTDGHSAWATEIASKTTDVIGVSNNLEVDSKLNFADSMVVVGKSLDKQYRELLMRTPFLFAGMVVLGLTWLVSKVIGFALVQIVDSRDRLRANLKDLIKQLSSIAVWVAGVLLATVVVFPGMTPAKALTVLGLGSVAIGFAFKDIFENFFAGVLILWRYPIQKGDFIECGDIVGKVEEITIRNTMLRRTDGELAVVPNAQLFKSNVIILTNRAKRRVRITCGVGYGESVEKSREVIRAAVSGCESVSGPKSVEIFASEFGDSSVDFEVAWWTGATPLEVRESRDEVIESIKIALDEAGIEIPFPYRTLTFSQPLGIKRDGMHNRTRSDAMANGSAM
jgi:small-conductance mechanosensitive channel